MLTTTDIKKMSIRPFIGTLTPHITPEHFAAIIAIATVATVESVATTRNNTLSLIHI